MECRKQWLMFYFTVQIATFEKILHNSVYCLHSFSFPVLILLPNKFIQKLQYKSFLKFKSNFPILTLQSNINL